MPLLGRWSLNSSRPAVDQTTMRMPEVSHPSPTTAEDFRRVLDVIVTHDRDLVIRATEPLLRRLVPES
jgi:hypothetical protein